MADSVCHVVGSGSRYWQWRVNTRDILPCIKVEVCILAVSVMITCREWYIIKVVSIACVYTLPIM